MQCTSFQLRFLEMVTLTHTQILTAPIGAWGKGKGPPSDGHSGTIWIEEAITSIWRYAQFWNVGQIEPLQGRTKSGRGGRGGSPTLRKGPGAAQAPGGVQGWGAWGESPP